MRIARQNIQLELAFSLKPEGEAREQNAAGTEMRRIGSTVLEASSGQYAFVLLDQKIDVLIIDIQLPGILNSWDVAEAYRTARPDMLIIYTSANPAIKSGQVFGSNFLSKPRQTFEIIEICRGLCRGK